MIWSNGQTTITVPVNEVFHNGSRLAQNDVPVAHDW
ncbi:hypothetical protein Q058_00134 [Pseudomonas aeruginosa BL04]|nr:hypothetical protein Q058_00134 [Pseudomonas aeruginosa BL04]